jgi:diguanylate cyclase (GGDEF)-like protein
MPTRLPNGEVAWDGVGVDVTVEKSAWRRLDYLGNHDALTGLPNRNLLVERLAAAVVQAMSTGAPVELSHVMLAGLSEINETLGTGEGEVALKGAAARLSELAIAAGGLAARVGSNELAVLRHVPPAGPLDDDFAAILMQSLSQPIPLGDEFALMEPCIGTALLDLNEARGASGEATAAELMKRASIALSAAHREGPGTHLLYRDTLDHRRQHRMRLRHSLRRAIETEEFVLHYQPQVDLQTGRIVAGEALVRWQHPQFGLVRPDVFISLAEESGLIGSLGDWVMRRALRQLKEWEDAGIHLPRLSINVSAIQLKAKGFSASVGRLIEEAGVSSEQIEIEITEGVLLESSNDVIGAIKDIKSMGVSVAIDDFGAGHSSLQYLRDFTVDTLKIDQMFVRQLVVDSSDAMIVKAIASLARSLKLQLVAEGIETVEQRDFLREEGCALGQGYLFSLPLDAEDFGWMLENRIALPVPARRNGASAAGGVNS